MVRSGPTYGVTGTVTGEPDLVRLAYSTVMALAKSARSSGGQSSSEMRGS
jgi:hypothetical protein